MPVGGSRRVVLVIAAAVAVVAGLVWWGGAGRVAPRAEAPAAPETAAAPPAEPGVAPETGVATAPADEQGDDALAAGPDGGGDPLAALTAPQGPWSVVDLDAVRAEMPDNVFWTMSSPTKDPEVLRARDEERARWNVEYGKILSNTATAEEIDAYYAHRQKLSADYVEFAGYLLAEYGEQLPRRDVALLKLAVDLHLARLEEIPRQMAEAHARREAHDATRRAWLEEQRRFAGDDAPAP